MDGTTKPDELLIKRTSSSSSHRGRPPHPQGIGRKPGWSHHIAPGAPWPHVPGDPDHSMARPSHVPADAPVVPHTDLASSSKRPNGSIENNRALTTQAEGESRDRTMARVLAGEDVPKPGPGRPRSVFRTPEETRAVRREEKKRWFDSLTPDRKAKVRARNAAQAAKSRARRKAWLRGSPGPPYQKPSREAKKWEEWAEQTRQHALVDARIEGARQRALPAVQGPATMRPTTPESSSGSWSVPASPLPEATNHRFAPGPSSSTLDFLSLSAPGSSTSGQKQILRAPRQAASLAAPRTREEERLRLTLAPPGQHDEEDRLRLTLAPPRHD